MTLGTNQQNPWKTKSSKLIYQNDWISLREDQVIRPDGAPGIYGVVSANVATGVVAVSAVGELHLVGQFRYPTEHYSWEIIEGGAKPDETPLQAAQRELAEEAGLSAEKWQPLGGEVHLSNCFSAERARIFLARGLTEVPKNPDATEVLMQRTVPFPEAVEMVHAGAIQDAMSIIGILWAETALRREGLL